DHAPRQHHAARQRHGRKDRREARGNYPRRVSSNLRLSSTAESLQRRFDLLVRCGPAALRRIEHVRFVLGWLIDPGPPRLDVARRFLELRNIFFRPRGQTLDQALGVATAAFYHKLLPPHPRGLSPALAWAMLPEGANGRKKHSPQRRRAARLAAADPQRERGAAHLPGAGRALRWRARGPRSAARTRTPWRRHAATSHRVARGRRARACAQRCPWRPPDRE